MHRSRLLLAVPAATALVLTGLSPAWAAPGNDHGRARAVITDIDNDAHANRAGDRVRVEFTYRCRGHEDDIDVTVRLRQHDARFRAEFNGKNKLDCDGHRHTVSVRLRPDNGDDLENGDARVTVVFKDDDDVIARRSETVDVRGVRDNDRDNRDKHDYGFAYLFAS
jgi:hypothetical protein